MRHFVLTTMTSLAVLALGAGGARAEGVWFSFHEASGSGWANLFDGGPVVTDEDATTGPDDALMIFTAIDSTQPGSFGAGVTGAGVSWIVPLFEEDGMHLSVGLDAWYSPSLFPGGDNPGGAAEAEIHSIIEFIMPADELLWDYQLQIRDTIDFDGTTSVVFENVTQSQVVLELTSEVFLPIETTLTGQTGDLMRLTTTMSGAGSTGPPGGGGYESTLRMGFAVPEPGTFFLVLVGLFLLALRRKDGVNEFLK